MIHAFPHYDNGTAILEFHNKSSEPVVLSAAIAFPTGPFGSGIPLKINKVELSPGQWEAVDISQSLIRMMQGLPQPRMTFKIHLSLSPDVNSKIDEGVYVVTYENGRLTGFNAGE